MSGQPLARGTAAMRSHRLELQTMAPASPPAIVWAALRHVRGGRVADVGCGAGVAGYLLRTAWSHTESWRDQRILAPERIVAVDRSPVAVAVARRHAVYDLVGCGDAGRLPLADHAVDTVLCLETLEHLFPPAAAAALGQLARVARQRVIITTPVPWRVVDRAELRQERAAALADPRPLPYPEFRLLGAALHKTWLRPLAMARAGFRFTGRVVDGSLVYLGDPARLSLAELAELPGVRWAGYPDDDGRGDWRTAYLELVDAVRHLGRRAPSRWSRARFAVRRVGRRGMTASG